MKKAAPFLLVAILLLGLILPNGIRAAIANNFWSVSFVKAYLAESLTTEQLSTSPKTHPHAKLLQARVAMDNGDYEEALQLLEPVDSTSDPVILETYAELLFLSENYPEALEIWKQLGQYLKLYHVSRLLLAKGELDMASLAIQKAADIRPDIYAGAAISYQIDAANSLRDKGNLVEAISRYQDISIQSPNDARPYLELAGTYWRNGQQDLAISALDKFLGLPSTNFRAYIWAGTIYEQKGQNEKALLAFQKALDMNPGNIDALSGIERLTNPQ